MKKTFFLALLVTSCNFAPRYERPCMDIPEQWRVPTNEQHEICNIRWWEQFCDPLLDDLIETALANNQDLKAAIYRVDEFYAQWGIANSALFPQISGNAVFEREKISTTLEPLTPGLVSTFDAYALLLNATYQLDLWGQLRNADEAAFALFLSSIQARRGIVLTLVSSVAMGYIQLETYRKQLEISKETLKTRLQSYELSKIRFSLGLTSQLQVDQSKSEVENAEVTVKQLEISIALQEDLLSFLVGIPSTAICGGKLIDEICMPMDIPAALPCALINQRPDILAAEQNLVSANANIGVARALFFPQVNLFGTIDTETSFWNLLFRSPSTTWEYGTSILQEVFTGGRLTSGLCLAKSTKMELLHTYQSTILNAFKEVNDALISHKIYMELVGVQKERVETLADYFYLSTLRYQEGLIDYLTVLDAERQLFRAQLDLAETQGNSFISVVQIYQALGGGWVVDSDEEALDEQGCYYPDPNIFKR